MEKFRVYELAKELNTTSKRLMEKLSEVNVVVKNHMSLLDDHELDALYKHIGVVKHDDSKKSESDEKKLANIATQKTEVKTDVKTDAKKDAKHAPRIIRKTEIIIDTKHDNKDSNVSQRNDFQRNDNQRNDYQRNDYQRNDYQRNDYQRNDNGAQNGNNLRTGQRQDSGRFNESNSGLRAGYTRDSRDMYQKDFKAPIKNDNRTEIPKEPVKVEMKTIQNVEEKIITPIIAIQNSEKNDENKEIKSNHIEVTNEQKNEQKNEQEKAEITEKTEKEAEVNVKSPENTQSQRPQSNNYRGPNDRPQGSFRGPNDRPQGDRPQYDRPQGGYNRGPSDRPQGQGSYQQGGGGYNRGPIDRPQGQGSYQQSGGGYNRGPIDRPQGDRPQGDRPQYDRPQGGYNRGPSDRPQGQGGYQQGGGGYNRGPSDRPQGQGGYQQGGGGYNRGPSDRPQGQGGYQQGGGGYNRGPSDRPQGQGGYQQGGGGYNRGPSDRPQGQGGYQQGGGGYNRGPSDRPQGQGGYQQGGGGYNRGSNDRPQGGGYNRGPQQGNYRTGSRPMDIPKPELSDAQKEELSSQRNEIRREFQTKDVDKDVKREQKREIPKGQQAAERNKRFRPQRTGLGEKKGVSEVMSDDFILEEFYTNDGVKRTRRVSKPKRTNESKHIPHRAVLTSIKVAETITVKDLAEALKKTSTDVIKKLMALGMMVTLNHELDFDTATIVAEEFGIKTEKEVVVNEEDILFDEDEEEDQSKMEARPPVVVVMGHVDHGKTSLLDAIRETNVIESEAGGITQHIGAYTVKINHRNITFLDTPGHEAFTAMRARGAQVTDVAIIVVAADDGVMPQTIEAIDHAKAANVSIIIAINKMDKPGANPEKVKQELTEYGIVAEEWGGDAIMVPVSAKKREGIDHLLEMVLLAADMLELKANPHKQAKGTIIEAKLDKDRGPVATVLVQRGTLNTGDSIVTGTAVGRIRAMADDKGHKLKKAGPSMPVEILGLPEVPEAGQIFYAITDEKVAKQLAEKRKLKIREQQLKASAMVSLEDLYAQIKEGKVKDLNLIIKADVQGSVEAVKQSIQKLSNDEVRVKIIHGGVGAITEADVTLAQVASAIIIGFNVRPGANVADIANTAGVDIRLYKIIYKALEDIQAAMKGMLEPTFKEVIQGHAEVRQVIKVTSVGTIAGSYVTDGKISRGAEVRVVRGGIVVHEGKLSSLKRFKDDVKEVAEKYECGIAIEKYNDLKELDIIEAFVMEEVAR